MQNINSSSYQMIYKHTLHSEDPSSSITMKLSCSILLLASALALASGSPTLIGQPQGNRTEPSGRIVDGYPAYEGKAPYIVGLFLLTDGSNSGAVGAGSIISNTWVLTAAHCLTTDSVDINYGSNWGWKGQYKHNVRRNNFILHPGFGNSAGHDIGLIRTPYVEYTNVVNRIPLPTFNQQGDRFEGWWCVACGWGGMSNGNLADWLQCIDVQIISNNECSQSYGSVASTDMCTRMSDGRSVCGGDSGGPLVTQDDPKLVGVITFASVSCKNGPSGYTRVSDHLEWIREHSGVAYY